MVDEDNLRGEVALKLSLSSLKRVVGMQLDEVDTATVLWVSSIESFLVLIGSSLLAGKLILNFFGDLLNLILLFITVFNTLVISFTVDNEVW